MASINHILFFISLIIMPALVFIDNQKIKASDDPHIKEKTYFKIFISYWAITAGFLIFSPFPNIIFINNPIILNNLLIIIASLIALYLLFTQVLPIILLTSSEKLRKLTITSFDKKSYIFPTTNRQRKLFIIVPITVGICEEIIFRGYLFQYLHSSPYNLNAIISFLLATLIFGLGHLQQGLTGIILSVLLGFFLGFLYFLTGNLFLSILLHIIFDAKILFISTLLYKYKPST